MSDHKHYPGYVAPEPTWGVAWTDAGPGYDSRLRCEECHRCIYYTHEHAHAAREAMRAHIEDAHTTNRMVVYLVTSGPQAGWMVRHEGPWAEQIRKLFKGSDTLPAAFTPEASAEEVLRKLRERAEAGVVVRLDARYSPGRCLGCGREHFHAEDCPTPGDVTPAAETGRKLAEIG